MSEFNARVAEKVMGWKAYSEQRGQYTLAVTQPPGRRPPWESSQNSEAVRKRYTEITCEQAQRLGFFGTGFPPYDTDANADYSVLPEVAKWTPQDQYRFNDEMERIINRRAVALSKPPSACWTLLKVGDFARAALAVKESADAT